MGIGTVLLLIVAAGVLGTVGLYNGLIRKRVETENAWSQIDVQLKRRHDLIPNLVETVKGYAGHESKTLEAVISARNHAVTASAADPATRIAAENALSGTLKSLFALSESYPDLKANQNFLALQEELSSTENRIGFSRQHYNDSVGVYNAAIQSFPANLLAGSFNFKPATFYQLAEAEKQAVQEAPRVSF
ncbi:MAG: LemA family protein [Oligoflexia bacterium]|nr:LemA family protein [Oligoflexia bacterium]